MTATAKKNDDVILSLSTTVAPAKHISVDDVEYDLLTLEHLSKAQEARVIYLFKKHDRLAQVLDEVDDEKRAMAAALDQTKIRVDLLTTITTMPAEVAEKLNLPAGTKVLEAFAREAGLMEE